MSEGPEELRQRIEETRGDLSRDLDELAVKVSPTRVAHERADQVAQATRQGVHQVRSNPPAAIGALLGLAALVAVIVVVRRRRR